jgi:hypothetical protein
VLQPDPNRAFLADKLVSWEAVKAFFNAEEDEVSAKVSGDIAGFNLAP